MVFALIKFIIKTAWIVLIAATTCFFMMQYFLPNIMNDFGQKAAINLEKKFNSKIDSIKDKSNSKKIAEEFKKFIDKVSK